MPIEIYDYKLQAMVDKLCWIISVELGYPDMTDIWFMFLINVIKRTAEVPKTGFIQYESEPELSETLTLVISIQWISYNKWNNIFVIVSGFYNGQYIA